MGKNKNRKKPVTGIVTQRKQPDLNIGPGDTSPPGFAGAGRQTLDSTRRPQTELPISPLPFWGVPATYGALVQHEMGNFRQSAFLCEALTQDPRIYAALSQRTKAITGLKKTFVPADKSPKAIEIAERASKEWSRWLSEQESETYHRWILTAGVGIGQLLWKPEENSNYWRPHFNCWHLSNLYWYWMPDKKFGVWNLVDATNGVVNPVGGDGQWVFFRTTDKRPGLQGLVRTLAIRFLARTDNIRSAARLIEKHGLAFIVNKVPQTALEEDIATVEGQVANLGSEPIVTLKQGDKDNQWDMDFKQVNAQGFEVFRWMAQECADDCVIAILGQNLTSQVKGKGSYAAAMQHNEIRQELVRADAEMLATHFTDQVLRPWAAINYGSADLAPRLEYVTPNQQTLADKAQALKFLADALAEFREAGIDVDTDAVALDVGLPIRPTGDAKNQPKVAEEGEHEALQEGNEEETTPAETALRSSPLDGFIKGERAKDRVAVSAVALHNRRGEILLGRRRDSGKWCPPSGHALPNESPVTCATREAIEESGLLPTGMQHIGTVQGRKGVVITVFRALADGTPTNSGDPDDEFSEFVWVNPQELPDEIVLHHKPDAVFETLGVRTSKRKPKIETPPERTSGFSVQRPTVPRYSSLTATEGEDEHE